MFKKKTGLSTDLSTIIPQRRSVFAIFVHFGPSDTTNEAVATLLRGSVSPAAVIVVDHGEAVFTSSLPITIVRPDRNGGYAEGLEIGIAKARAIGARDHDLCLLLNNDALIGGSSIQAILTWWTSWGGPLILGGSLGGYVSLFSGKARIVLQPERSRSWLVPYIHGAGMVGEFGLFARYRIPRSLFLYWEDVALSMKIQQSGGRLAIIPGFTIEHDDKAGLLSLEKLFYLVRNGAYVLERYTSIPWGLYWRGMNTARRMYHSQFESMKHVTILRALRDARDSRLGRVEL